MSVLFLGFASSTVRASSDINYQFQNDNLFNSTGFGQQSWLDNNSNTFNIRQRESITLTQTYNATYSFTNEINYINDTTIDFIDSVTSVPSTTYVSIYPEFSGHSKILTIIDDDGSSLIATHDLDNPATYGSFEFWWYIEDASFYNILIFGDESSTDSIFFYTLNDKWDYNDGAQHEITNAYDNQWYHISFDFETTAGSYKGLSNDRWRVRINGIEFGDFEFRGTPTNLDIFQFETGSAHSGYNSYIDAIGYSWDDNYTIGDNLKYYTRTIEDEYEVDKWEFRHDSTTRTQYVDGLSHVSGWNHVDIVGTDTNTLNVGGDLDIVIHCDDNGGMEREFGTMYDDYFNVSFNFGVNDIDDDDVGANAVITKLEDSNGDTIVSTYLRYDGVVEVFAGGTGNIVGTLGDPEANFTITYLINFPAQSVYFTLSNWNTGEVIYTFFGTFYEPCIDMGKVEYFQLSTDADLVDSYLFSISIYNTTGSVSDETGELLWVQAGFTPDTPEWYFNEFNLIALNGVFENMSLFHEAFGGISFASFIDWTTHSYEFTNIFEYASLSTGLTYLKIWMYYNFSFTNISIDGVKLNDGTNDFPLDFVSGGVDISESYFYVVGNRLYFNLNTNDANLEFIQAGFNIDDLITENYSISFWSDVFGASSCNVRLNYTDDTSSFFEFPTRATHTSIILPQEREIDNFIILITDNDKISTGSTTGYIRDVSFISFTDITVTIATLSLLTVLIPLIVLIVPTVAMKMKFGKSAVIPMFLLMSVVAFATELIPIWLFFIIMIASGVFLVSKKAIGDEF